MLKVTFVLLLAALLASCSGPVYEQAQPPLQLPFVLTADCTGDAVTLCSCAEPQQTQDGRQVYENGRLRVTVQNGVVQSIACLESGSSYRITGFQLLSAPSD